MSAFTPPSSVDSFGSTPPDPHIFSAEFLQCIINTIPDAMVVLDDDGRILSFSRAAEALFGHAASEVIGQSAWMLFAYGRDAGDGVGGGADGAHRKDDVLHYLGAQGRRKAARGSSGSHRVIRARHRSGERFPIDLTIGQVMVDGHMVFAVFIRDLRAAEHEKRRLHLLQAELAQVSRISSMGMLASAIAHELNQPLAAIVNYAETIQAMTAEGRIDQGAIQTAMQHCSQEAMRASEVIRRLRGFLARGDMERSRSSLQELIGDALALALVDGEGAGVSVSLEHDASADTTFADRVQIQQVVLNLLRNALEAMAGQEARSIFIRTAKLEATQAKSGPPMVEIVVADSGPGIEPHIAQRLFQPFQSTKASGMGIGLSICHTIVDGHGGKIWAEPSTLGGTAFHFTLPLMQDIVEDALS